MISRIAGYILAFIRLLLFLVITLTYVGISLLVSLFSGGDLDRIMRIRRSWIRTVFPVLGIAVRKSGTLPDYPCFILANHISYIDPIAIMLYLDGLPVAKMEVANWPLIGYAASLSGTVFVQREDGKSRRSVLNKMVECWQDGYNVINFPEGTTTDQNYTVDFKKGGFRAAAELGIPIVPVAVWFSQPDAPFLGEEKFLPHFFRCFSHWKTICWLHFSEVQKMEVEDELLNAVKAEIDLHLKRLS